MSKNDSGRVLLLVGVYRADWEDERFRASTIPLVVDVLDATVWEHMPDEEIEARWAERRRAFDPHGMDYEWRQVWVRLDGAGLRAPFEIQEVAADIEAPASTSEVSP